MENNWLIQDIWNNTMIDEPRETKPRDYIRASELGRSYLDRYYSMKGVTPTNDFDSRILRVFEAGNLYEWLVKLVLIRAGILKAEQTPFTLEGENHLPIHGRLDFVAGGKPNWEAAKAVMPMLEELQFPVRMLKTIGQNLEEKYPDGMKELLIEVKSVNSMVFWKHQKAGTRNEPLFDAYRHHVLQLYTYMKAMNISEGRILYISKDDLTLAEVAVTYDEKLDLEWKTDIETMTKYYNTNTIPKTEDEIVWNDTKVKYELNWNIGRSPYFELIIKLSKDFWQAEITKLVSRLNYRVKKFQKESPTTSSISIQDQLAGYLSAELGTIYGKSQDSELPGL